MRLTLDAPRPVRRRTPARARREIVAQYQRSDLTQRAFCAQAGLPISTLQWWLVQARREAARSAPAAFTEVQMPAAAPRDPDVGASAWAVELVTPRGVTLRLREPVAPAVLRDLLRHV
jgi:transposase-like protein